MNTNIASQAFAIVCDLLMPRPHAPIARQTPQVAVSLPSQPIIGISGQEARKSLAQGDMQLMTIKLATMIGVPIKYIEVLERYGNVWVIKFIAHGQIDPIMPITAVALGKAHDYAYMRLAGLVQAWRPQQPYDDTNQQAVWFQSAQSFALRCASEATQVLPLKEAQYYTQQIMFTVANPDQRQVWLKGT